ncbi:MAG: stage III sporulation protein AG [Lachnospiraceae bacterium]|nr:stage III sporulation protein AG [Lachnospiraceae bacterium]
MKDRWKKFKEKFWPPRKDQLLIFILVGLLLAVIAIPVDERAKEEIRNSGLSETVMEDPTVSMDYESRMEQKLEELLGSVEGVGNVRVMLTFEGTGERKVEKDTSVTADSQQEETVYEEYGSSERTPYVTSETNPQVEGVLVIAQGGGNSRIQKEIIEAAQALFGIEAHKIKIMKMEGTK